MAQVRRQTMVAAPAPRPQQPMLSIFDLDRTLTILPTYTPFLLFAVRSRAPWRLLLLPLLLPVALFYAMKLIPRCRMKQAMHWVALGGALPEREAAWLADRFARDLVAHGLYAEGVALIEAERAAGRQVVLATAAPHFYTAALARRLGIPRASILRTAASTSAGSISPIGNRPMDALRRVSRDSVRMTVDAAHPFSPSRCRLAQYSAAMAANVLSTDSFALIFSRCFSRAGSPPRAICSRAASRRLRASLKLTSG